MVAAVIASETIDRLVEHKSQQSADNDPRLIHANKGIVALSVLVQHLAFNVSRIEVALLLLLFLSLCLRRLSLRFTRSP